ncbi:hypothetical protein KQ302_07035 [Synechococcus sp. CS-602]|uniref:hypothetical protein n=1 Tax=Synechococcaceae TaxID=1890426 RepID=UPI0008FF6947|nr:MULTISPECIES: hypothetical protein [Synechococcaceae]MCT4364620.1 hypothetical protein [Candidatus Regnicoccus frigidus MAG-AL1]APD47792.1 hypothetical protein BM449_05350 [Synechococcus sp. SynAce01]MCT0202865.1 hypothetical protein [Synechococcus sp. CS-603]MCT0204855.1 hypothetical protein [Synechococcus sp. CS-602]MCT0245091.1 hypothetical protein [Synechococcus sp. CS-601]
MSSSSLQLSTLAGCALTIGGYPRFRYNASGGGGLGRIGGDPLGGQRQPAAPVAGLALDFEPSELTIPPLDWRSTRFLGLPLPPGLRIAIEPERLAGSLDGESGAVTLQFRARFLFSLGSLYRAPALRVDTELTSGALVSQRHRSSGQPLAGDGTALLVGVATIEPCGEPWLDRFLGLPDEALAVLRCRFRALPATACHSGPPAGRSAPGQSGPA